jgi:isocitrate/isopropylmalate dehydrogenase
MLEWFNEAESRRGAAMIRRAVEAVLKNPVHRTPDLGGKLSTRAMGDLVIDNL